jgi:hypothetical protein
MESHIQDKQWQHARIQVGSWGHAPKYRKNTINYDNMQYKIMFIELLIIRKKEEKKSDDES